MCSSFSPRLRSRSSSRHSDPAGGWATVGFEPLPDGMSAGGTWNPTIFVKQHGVTPLAGLQPVVEIDDDRTGAADEVPRDRDVRGRRVRGGRRLPDAG